MIDIEERGEVRIARLARGKANALDQSFLEALLAEFDAAERSPAKAWLVTASGSTFCAGVDLHAVLAGGSDYLQRFLPLLVKALFRLLTFPKPTVAAVNGHAIAGGCLIAVACDQRLMAQGPGKIGLTELLVGVPFPTLALEIGRRAFARAAFDEAVYTAKLYSPTEAARIGLVHDLVEPDQLLARATDRAQLLGRVPANTYRITKRQLLQPTLDRFEKYWPAMDPEVFAAWVEPSMLEHIRAFVERTVRKG